MCAIIIVRLIICYREATIIMKVKKCFGNGFKQAFLRYLFAFILLITGAFGTVSGGLISGDSAFAEPDISTPTRIVVDPDDEKPDEEGETDEPSTGEPPDIAAPSNLNDATPNTSGGADECQNSLGAIGWLVCPTTGKISEAVDWLYERIEGILVINPIEANDGSPIYEIWKYCRGVTNLVFIIFLLVVIYSQITGYGISNYGLKKALPKLIVAAVLVNLSFLICQLGVDLSNVIGSGLRGLFTAVQETAISSMEISPEAVESMNLMYSQLYGVLAGGSVLAIGATVISFETGAIWMLIPIVLGAIVAVASGLITIALRQAVVALLVMIAPLAIVANILPNTENLFKKWKKLFIQMLVFYPMFSLLFGASSLAGFAIIASAKDAFWLILGLAVQVFPLFFSWSLMRMSGTVLGTINTKINGLASRPLAGTRAWADSHRQATKAKNLVSARTPSMALMAYLSNRRIAREAEMDENRTTAKNRGLAYRASRNYKKDGSASREGMKAYKQQAENMRYAEIIERDKNNMNKGLGVLAAQPKSKAMRERLQQLDVENVAASDRLKIEKARGEIIEYENAVGFHKRMEGAINAHMDDKYGYKKNENGEKTKRDDYRFHFTDNNAAAEARARYSAMNRIMEGNELNTQYAAATAAASYDTQKKIVETKMGKYFELTPPTRDVEYRLGELTKSANAISNIDSIIAGMRVLNQRGDTDLLKQQLDNVLNRGVELGTHASQSLASFLMFEVKDNDPFLRRFGKYINLETARAYNKNERQVMNVTYDEYIKGYHDGEAGLVNDKNPTGRMYAKKGMRQLVEGTSLDSIERTALSNLDDSLKKAYGYDENDSSKKWDVAGWLKKREEIQTAFEPAFLSASLKWLSGSEQISSGVKFWTGYEQKQKKDSEGNAVVDDNGNPMYEWTSVWNDKAFAGHEDEVEKYFRRKTHDYINDQTTGQILGMRTDYREPIVEHLVNMYLEDGDEDEVNEKKRKYEEAKAEIQTRYADEKPSVAKKKRDADLTKLKREMTGEQLRKILDKTGKLEQIYTTRRSGAANNAKDWLRKMLNLDDKNAIYEYLDSKDARRKKQKGQQSTMEQQVSGDEMTNNTPYGDIGFRTRVMTELYKVFDRSGDEADSDNEFYEKSMEKIRKEFGEDSELAVLYAKYREDNPNADRSELWDALEEILGNFFAGYDDSDNK